eukprot:Opistho-2@55270
MLKSNLPLFQQFASKYAKGEHKGVDALLPEVANADAYIVVSGEYNHSIPPALSNMLDHFMPEYRFKPFGLVTYSAGPWGGVRTVSQLRSLLGEVGGVTCSTTFPIPVVMNQFNEAGEDVTPDKGNVARSKRLIDELEFYAHGLKQARAGGVPF